MCGRTVNRKSQMESSANPPASDEDHHQRFDAFGLDPRILAALDDLGWQQPTPIQAEVMSHLLLGRDVIGRARTGSGKTAAFGLPLLERVKTGQGGTRALVLCPTRELALQVTAALESFATKLPVELICVYGGAAYKPQINALRRGVSVVVGTPGRLLDLLERGHLDLSAIETVVVDEADELLRMGFIDDVELLLDATPDSRQVALFSATMPEPIRKVSQRFSNPVEVEVESRALSVDHITQLWLEVPERNKLDALVRVLDGLVSGTTLVFCRTRVSCAETADTLARRGLAVDALHGDMNQQARERVLRRLRAKRLKIVIATDVAARGIDVDHITHVINYDLPPEPESYVHRIGRTGRAGREGKAIAFCDQSEGAYLRDIERLIGESIAVDDTHPWHAPDAIPPMRSQRPVHQHRPGGGRPRGSSGRRRGGARR